MAERADNGTIRDGLDRSKRGTPHAARCGALACPCYIEAQRKMADLVREYAADVYPEDVFTPDGTTPDAEGARFARRICEAVATKIEEAVDA
jgi:hypothetical protein